MVGKIILLGVVGLLVVSFFGFLGEDSENTLDEVHFEE